MCHNKHKKPAKQYKKALSQPTKSLIIHSCENKRQSHSKHSDDNCQKHAKMCPDNHLLNDKYDLALPIKNKNKMKMNQARKDPTF